MHKNQVQDQGNKEKENIKQGASKAGGDKNREQKERAPNQGGKSGSVLGEVNDDAKKTSKRTKREMK